MNWFKKLINSINKYPFTRNVVLAVCAIIVFVFLSSLLLNIFTRHNVHKQVPDLKGMKIEDVRRAARRAKVRIEISDSLHIAAHEPGIVLDQKPEPGTQVKPGRRVFLTINSAQRKKVELPYVTGYSLRQAKNMLEMAELEIDKITYRSDIATFNVLEERLGKELITSSSKLMVEKGSKINLVVGLSPGAASPTVPRLVGFPLAEAKSRIWEAGLNIGTIEMDDDVNLLNLSQAKVWLQSPSYPQRLSHGKEVDIKLTLDDKKVESGSKQSDSKAKSVAAQQAADEAKEAEAVAQKEE